MEAQRRQTVEQSSNKKLKQIWLLDADLVQPTCGGGGSGSAVQHRNHVPHRHLAATKQTKDWINSIPITENESIVIY